MAAEEIDEAEAFELARRRRLRIGLASVAGLAFMIGLLVVLTRPSPCAAFVAELCEGTTADCSGLEASFTQVGIGEQECREASKTLDATLDGAPPAAVPYVKAEALLQLYEGHVDPEQLTQLRRQRPGAK